eukprot:TRINITY_DN4700_c2_g2_i1.p1 TRINITY_DN4700_c2_g2~~TRINITY_DN4700_c2_g2_i1.p1  ORF type:complete len:200 (+),score=58.61 TRINITY_DN4700_c2_g2_i1:64-663(+)
MSKMARNLLVVKSSMNGAKGNSNKLAGAFMTAWAGKHEGGVTIRDIGQENLPHLNPQEMGAWGTPVSKRTVEENKLAAVSDNLVEEVKEADVVVLAVSMYNFGMPSTLKAWVDRILRAGVTFNYTETGPVGKLTDKKVYVLVASGGVYTDTPHDNLTPYLKQTLGFVGITDVVFVRAEGMSMDADSGIKSAMEKIDNLF